MKKLILLLALITSTLCASAQMEKGYRGFVEIGHNFGKFNCLNEDFRNRAFFISTTHGYQTSDIFYLGVGVLLSMWDKDNGHTYNQVKIATTPFVEGRFDFLSRSRIGLFETNKIGYSITPTDNKFYFAPALGIKYQLNNHLTLQLALSYKLGKYCYYSGYCNEPIDGLGLAIGLEF